MALTPQQFVDKWRRSEVKETSGYQEHFLDLCRMLGQPTPVEADPTGQHYTFEAGLTKLGGGKGRADVWKRGCFALEYKGRHANLERAYEQIQLYREALENPPLLVVSDMEIIEIHTNFTGTVKRKVVIGFDEILTPAGQQALRDLFKNPGACKAAQTTEEVTKEAARETAGPTTCRSRGFWSGCWRSI
jgi:hypothetical protein